MQSPRSLLGTPLAAVSAPTPSSATEDNIVSETTPMTLEAPTRHVVDHQGAGRIVHRPDGTVIWESVGPAADRGGRPTGLQHAGKFVLEGAGVALLVSVGLGTTVGLFTALMEVNEARSSGEELTGRQLSTSIANMVASCIAGTLTGVILGPLQVVRSLGSHLVRPAVLGVALHQGWAWLSRHRLGVAALLKKLESGLMSPQLEALRAIVLRAMHSAAFRREFNKFGGVEVVLSLLREALAAAEAAGCDSPLLHLLAQALAELAKDNDCKEALVAAGGVPLLVRLLGPCTAAGGDSAALPAALSASAAGQNPVVVQYALAALASMSDQPLAQDAIREAGGARRLLEIAALPSRSVGALARVQALTLLGAVALDPAGKQAIGAAGGVEALLGVVKGSVPRSAIQAQAAVTLHAAVRGLDCNQRSLAAMDEAEPALRGALAAAGPHWCAHKADLRALLLVLSRRSALADELSPLSLSGGRTPVDLGSPGGWVDAATTPR